MIRAATLDVSVIVCTYDRCQTLAQVLADLRSQRVPVDLAWEIVVVDNNSSDSTREVVEQVALLSEGRVRYVFEGRQGKSFALNTGVDASRGEVLLFTDDDVRIEPDWMSSMVGHFRREPRCQGLGGKVLPLLPDRRPADLDDEEIQTYFRFDLGSESLALARAPYGANMAYRRQVFHRHGHFRTDLGPTHEDRGGLGEDTELAMRILDAGEVLCYVPEAVVHHIILPEELTLQHLDQWHFAYGRSVQRRDPTPEGSTRFFGAPRFLLKRLLAAWLRMVLSRGAERHHWRWQLQKLRGQIHEARREGRRSVLEEVSL